MARKKRSERIEKEDNSYIKNIIFSIMIITLVFSIHIFLTNNVFKDEKTANANSVDVSKFELAAHMISINGEKSPNLDLAIDTDQPVLLIVEISGPDFFESVSEEGYTLEHNMNLILPGRLLGEDVEVNVIMYDKLNRRTEYKKSHSIPLFNAPRISVT